MSDTNPYAVLLGGKISPTRRLRSQLTGRSIIAADSGISHAKALNLEVDLWVGDFDSSTPSDRDEFRDIEVLEWPTDKDLTDGEIAIQAAYERGATSILLVGAFGGRTDHATNHLLGAFSMSDEVILSSGDQEALPIKEVCKPGWPNGTVFSILAFDNLKGVSIHGAKWPLENIEVSAGSSLTISNVVQGELEVSIQSGRALLIGNLEE